MTPSRLPRRGRPLPCRPSPLLFLLLSWGLLSKNWCHVWLTHKWGNTRSHFDVCLSMRACVCVFARTCSYIFERSEDDVCSVFVLVCPFMTLSMYVWVGACVRVRAHVCVISPSRLSDVCAMFLTVGPATCINSCPVSLLVTRCPIRQTLSSLLSLSFCSFSLSLFLLSLSLSALSRRTLSLTHKTRYMRLNSRTLAEGSPHEWSWTFFSFTPDGHSSQLEAEFPRRR